MKTWNVSEEALLSTYLTNRVCERAAGQIDPECLNNMPSDTYFIGNLRPVSEDDDNTPRYLRDLRNKLSPMAFGAEFRVLASEREITVQVYVSWNCYYRVFPTLLQQQEHQLREYRQDQNTTQNQVTHESVAVEEGDDLETEEDDTASSDEQFLSRDDDLSPLADEDALIESRVPHKPKSKRRSSTPKDSLAARFKKIECSASGTIRLWFDSDLGRWWSDCATLQDAINNEIERAQTLVASDPETLRIGNDDTSYIKVSESSLTNEETYRAFCASFPNVLVPDWALECKAESTSSTPEAIVLITFSNTSNVPLKGKNIEPYLFAVRAAFGFIQGQPKPFELELVPRSFRYDRTLQARGFNCAVEVDYEQGLYFTSNTPVHTQGRYSTRTEPPAPFVDLATDPLPILDAILAAMNQHLMEWDEAALDYAAKYHDWDQTYSSEFTRDRDLYVDEIRRFERGVELIRESADIELAFRLTNQTFLEAGTARGRSTKTKTSWRLFQIVFLVSQIPGITALTNPESRDALERSIVDIIYFPTGGGKTEAYLSVIVFHCFFDRLRGKTAGVTAWTRFPLRLLTLQQTQRVADVIGIADLIRKDHVDPRLSGKKVAGFAVGYLAGKEATPNELKEPGQGQPPDADWSKALDNRFRQRWKKVITCPSCGTQSVIVDFDHTKARVYHRCTNDDCRFDSGRIPVYVIDNEIYRYLPSVIVGTIDKLASVGNQRKLALGCVDI